MKKYFICVCMYKINVSLIDIFVLTMYEKEKRIRKIKQPLFSLNTMKYETAVAHDRSAIWHAIMLFSSYFHRCDSRHVGV